MRDIKNNVAVHGLKFEIGKYKFDRDDPCFAFGYAGQDPGTTVNRELTTVNSYKA